MILAIGETKSGPGFWAALCLSENSQSVAALLRWSIDPGLQFLIGGTQLGDGAVEVGSLAGRLVQRLFEFIEQAQDSAN